MGVYKLTFPRTGTQESTLGSKTSSGFCNAFDVRRRFHKVENRSSAPQPMSSSKTTSTTTLSSMEAPEMEHFGAISEDDDVHDSTSESVFTASMSTSTRTSNTISDDDSSMFLEFASRMSSTSLDVDFARAPPARHSTACCSDLAFRRELRKRFYVEPTVDEGGLRRGSTSSFALGNSFRRELEKEDCVESLALWEETDHRIQPLGSHNVVPSQNPIPHLWHAGEMIASSGSSSTRNKGLDAILRKKKLSFFNVFSGLSFSSYRKSRKSSG